MRLSRLILLVVGTCAVLAAGALTWHWQQHSMAAARAYTAGDASLPQHVLIATQGSAFKDELVSELVRQLAARSVYVQVIDVSALPSVHQGEWRAIVLVHTWEFGKPPRAVQAFIDRTPDRHRILAVTTSGRGHERMPGVDAISAASVMSDVAARVAEVSARLDALLASPAAPAAP